MTVHCSPNWKPVFGVITYSLKSNVCATVPSLCCPDAQVMSYQLPTTSTGSLKSTVMLESCGAFVPSSRGSVFDTQGPSSCSGVVRNGLGAPVVKSLPLLLLSVLPPFFRNNAVETESPGAFELPSLQFAAP